MINPETPALDIARAVAGGEVSAVAVTEAALARIEKLNPLLNAFTDVTAARARKRFRTRASWVNQRHRNLPA